MTKKRNNLKISIIVERKGKCQSWGGKKQQLKKTRTVSHNKTHTTLAGFTIVFSAIRKSLREMAERLADKYEEAKEKQEDITNRSVVVQHYVSRSGTTGATLCSNVNRATGSGPGAGSLTSPEAR